MFTKDKEKGSFVRAVLKPMTENQAKKEFTDSCEVCGKTFLGKPCKKYMTKARKVVCHKCKKADKA